MFEKEVVLKDKVFAKFKTKYQIKKRIKRIAKELNQVHTESSSNSVFISVLNGSFMFTSDLCREINFTPEIQFIKVKSYEGTQTTGKVEEIIGLKNSLYGKNVYIIEDIIDTGITISNLYMKISEMNPESITIVTLLYKPESYKGISLDLIFGFQIPNKFVVGYGMDYDEIGRSLKDLYILKEEEV